MAHKKSRIPFWLSGTHGKMQERFVMKGYTFYEHPAVKNLSAEAYRVYDYMCKECGGTIEFKIPQSVYTCFTTKPTFRKARNELIEKGFIEIVQNNANLRKPNVYRFSDKWKQM